MAPQSVQADVHAFAALRHGRGLTGRYASRGPGVEELVAELRKRYLDVFSSHLDGTTGKSFYASDLVVFGVLDRQIGLLEAMPNLFAEKNIHALAPLLRVQLDGLLRLHAFRMVENMHDLTSHMLKGKHLRNFKDRNGALLQDRHLVTTLSKELPWIDEMYSTLSGWVHLSSTHILTAVTEGEEDRTIQVGIGSFRENLPETIWEEARGAVRAIHGSTISMVERYFERESA